MTGEEALHRVKGYLTDIIPVEDYSEVEEIIKALEQEPCDDAISRQYLLDNCVVDKVTMPYVPVNKIKEAPPVIPQPKTGHWIMSDDGLYRPICNNCGAHPWKGYIPTVEETKEVFNYCPNCGVKMESEG